MNPSKRSRKGRIILLSTGAIVVLGLVLCVLIYVVLPPGVKTFNISAAISEAVGVVQVRDSAQAPFNPVNNGFRLQEQMLLQTREDSRARLDLSTGSIIRIGQLTVFSLQSQNPVSGGGLSEIQVAAGRVWVILNGGSLDVNTPAGLASVRGSYMSVWVEPNTNRITICCLEGKCGFKNNVADVDMTSGQKVVSSNLNVVPPVQKMDQTDVQSWIDNSPESIAMVRQISGLVVSSTPSLTPTSEASPTASLTPSPSPSASPSPSPTLSAQGGSSSSQGTAASATPSATIAFRASATSTLAPLYTKTPAFTVTNTSRPTRTHTPRPSRTPTSETQYYPPTSTDTPTPSETPTEESTDGNVIQ
jgi:hypothetical protein